MDEFRALWSDYVVPAREGLGFVVKGGWFDEETDTFVWLVGHAAPDGWEAVEKYYYESGVRETFPRSPGEFVAEIDTKLLTEAYAGTPAA